MGAWHVCRTLDIYALGIALIRLFDFTTPLCTFSVIDWRACKMANALPFGLNADGEFKFDWGIKQST